MTHTHLRCLLLWSALIPVAGCWQASLPDAPPEFNLKEEQATVQKNVEAQIAHVRNDPGLTEEEKERKVAEIRQGAEGYMESFKHSKEVRDQYYGQKEDG